MPSVRNRVRVLDMKNELRITIAQTIDGRWELWSYSDGRTNVALAWDSHNETTVAGMFRELARCVQAYGWNVTSVQVRQ